MFNFFDNIFEVHLHRSMDQYIMPCYSCITFHCMYIHTMYICISVCIYIQCISYLFICLSGHGHLSFSPPFDYCELCCYEYVCICICFSTIFQSFGVYTEGIIAGICIVYIFHHHPFFIAIIVNVKWYHCNYLYLNQNYLFLHMALSYCLLSFLLSLKGSL